MQKLPEASGRNRGDACAKKKDRPDKRRNLILFQQRPAEYQHLDLDELPKVTNTWQKLYIPNTLLKL